MVQWVKDLALPLQWLKYNTPRNDRDDRFANRILKIFGINLINRLKDVKDNMNMVWRKMKELKKEIEEFPLWCS